MTAHARSKKKPIPMAGAFSAAVLAGLAATSAATSSISGGVAATVATAEAPSVYPSTRPCPISGDRRGDPALNEQKNRITAPTSADIDSDVLSADDMINLTAPSELQGIKRDAWPDDASVAEVEALEAKSATITGYLIGVKEENTGQGESSNCHDPKRLFDYHIYIADEPNVSKAETAVVEMIPRWRAVHPTWGTAANAYAGYKKLLSLTNQQVRVTGWLLFDEEHLNQVGQYRATVWEIHPVTAFEYLRNGTWTPL